LSIKFYNTLKNLKKLKLSFYILNYTTRASKNNIKKFIIATNINSINLTKKLYNIYNLNKTGNYKKGSD